MLKVPIYMDLAEEGLDSNYSVVIFVNFLATLEYICHHMKTSCIIKGGQTIEERQKNINDFQANRSKIIVVMIQAGGIGISLHDLHGNHLF
jgi:SNF2 family DNA or RNA helicase